MEVEVEVEVGVEVARKPKSVLGQLFPQPPLEPCTSPNWPLAL